MSYGIGVYGISGVTSARTHAFGPYVDGKVIPEEPISRGSRVPAIFGFSMSLLSVEVSLHKLTDETYH